jgi:hypothetical protein
VFQSVQDYNKRRKGFALKKNRILRTWLGSFARNVLTNSSKGAKRCRGSQGFLCALASLREKIFFAEGTFRAKPRRTHRGCTEKKI